MAAADVAAAAGLVLLLAVVAGGVVGRGVSDLSGGRLALDLPGGVELARSALMVTVLSALPGAAARGLVRVDLLAERLPAPAVRGLSALWDLALAGVAGAAAWRLARAAADEAGAGEVSQVLGYPLWPVTAWGALALALLAAVALRRIVRPVDPSGP